MMTPPDLQKQIESAFAAWPGSANAAGAVLAALRERARQHEKWGEQNHDMMTWLAILHEETGELAEACLHQKFGGPEATNVYREAVQVAAVGLQIVEHLLRFYAKPSSEEVGDSQTDRTHGQNPAQPRSQPE